MNNPKMAAQITRSDGFIAALDQSGGSTPGALRLYGIPDAAYTSDAEMFTLMHEMRVRIMTSPAFTGAQVLAVHPVREHDGRPDEWNAGSCLPVGAWRRPLP
jgi:fructose-bisphosphate aldolase, class I